MGRGEARRERKSNKALFWREVEGNAIEERRRKPLQKAQKTSKMASNDNSMTIVVG